MYASTSTQAVAAIVIFYISKHHEAQPCLLQPAGIKTSGEKLQNGNNGKECQQCQA